MYANQDLDEIRRGVDFVAPQLIDVPRADYSNWPHFPSKATHDEAAGVIKLRHSVDANGKTTDIKIIKDIPDQQLGEFLKKILPRLNFTPGYRNGKPTASTYTLTWWFGRVVGR